MKSTNLAGIFLLFLSVFFFQACLFSAAKDVTSNAKPISHELFDSLLQQHVDEEGWVNYKGFIQDSTKLNKYITLLEANHPNEKFWTREERMAYWINVYNAYTIKVIIDNYPTKSIKDIQGGVGFINSIWDEKIINIEGNIYDLNNIEHNILRPKYKDPRIHFAVNCASYSCPPLLDRAFTPEKLEEQLHAQAIRFVNDPLRNKITPEKIQISKIFTWFSGDFKMNEKDNIIAFLNQYSETKINSDATVEYLDYDWVLNEK